MPKDCECPTPEIALAKGCQRAGTRMVGALYNICSGRCLTSAEPCPKEIRNRYLALWDGEALPPDPRALASLPDGKPIRQMDRGPGTELKALLDSLNLTSQSSCGCDAMVLQMNAWGVDGCRVNRDIIVKKLREAKGQLGMDQLLLAASRAIATGLAFRVNPLHPIPDLVDEAISRAEQKAAS